MVGHFDTVPNIMASAYVCTLEKLALTLAGDGVATLKSLLAGSARLL